MQPCEQCRTGRSILCSVGNPGNEEFEVEERKDRREPDAAVGSDGDEDTARFNAADYHALLLDVKQAAAMLGVSRATFFKLHSQGRVPLPIRLTSRVVRWRKQELEAWVRCGCPTREKWNIRTLKTIA
jgi:predicted DNA-binding transcriptional regulator AlpA